DLFIKVLLERYPSINFYIICREKYYHPFSRFNNAHLVLAPEYSTLTKIFNRFFAGAVKETKLIDIWNKFLTEESLNYDMYINVGGSIFIEG
ncbi:hypothetical protein ACPV5V_29325, partial [Vibrio campbellii]